MALARIGIRSFALQPRSPFVCRRCLQQKTLARSFPSLAKLVSSWRRHATTGSSPPLASLAEKIERAHKSESAPKPAVRPAQDHPAVGYWLLGSAASVFGIVVFGGLTRLTESGLSITEWRPVTGSLPPLSPADWESEFDKYRASPEFKMLNSHMKLDEFKRIYYMEWGHRLWGRVIGLSFVIPTIYLIARRRVTVQTGRRLAAISCLIGCQGLIGWWMVKSGLRDDLNEPGSHPRVSQYRLATHLATAFVCYSCMLLCGLGILRTHRLMKNPSKLLDTHGKLCNPALGPLRRCVTGLTALVSVTVLSGALVAGLDAGLIYNEFPKMGLGLAPPKSELWDRFYCRREDGSDLWWRNLLENPSLVQLDHRILATTTFCAVLALYAYSRTGQVKGAMPRAVSKGVLGLLHLVSIQVGLGISTLIYMVPVPLAAAHQAGALALLTGALALRQRLAKLSPSVMKLAKDQLHRKSS